MGAAQSGNSGLIAIVASVALAAVAVAAVVMPRLVIEVSRVDFIVITCLIGGWAGTMTGRAIASTWRPYCHVLFYMVLLALVVRWVHWALFHGTLASLHYYLVDLVVLGACGTLGYMTVRARQMTTQYRWLYRRSGPFGWTRQPENS
jgi:hypothetical protein